MGEMLNFAEYWSAYLKKHRLSYRKAAEICGISRTLAAQYADGKNKPSNEKSVQKISKCFGMDDRESKEMMTAYLISCFGKKEYYARRFLKNIRITYSNKGSGGGINGIGMKPEVIPSCDRLFEGDDVNNCLLWFVENSRHIHAIMQPEILSQNQFLQRVLSQKSDCCIEQIITLDADHSKDNIQDIMALEQLFSTVINAYDYRVYHCWSTMKNENNTSMNIMMSEAGLLVYNASLTKVFFTKEDSYMNYYRDMFREKKNKSGAFIRSAGNYDSNKDTFLLVGDNNKKLLIEEPGLVRLFRSI